MRNLTRARQNWARLTRILSREGADAWTLGYIYLAVLQVIILYESEILILTPYMKMVLGRLHHRVEHRLTGPKTWKRRDVGWVYPPLEDTMAESGLQEVDTYVSRLHNTVAQFTVTSPIVDLCLSVKQMPGTRVTMRWWEQDGLDLERLWAEAWEAEKTKGDEQMDRKDTATNY